METPAVWAGGEEGEEELRGDDDYSDIRKRLFDGLEPETPLKPCAGSKKQPVVVYLRIRPKSQLEVLNKDLDCLHQVSQSELLAVAPKNSQTYKNKNGARNLSEGNQKFTFTRIFEPATLQKELFDEVMIPTLKDFFTGQNCLVFTYGVTNSGKTYTVTGTSSEPGLLPRSLDVVFNTIDQRQFSSVAIRPKHFSDVTHLSERETEQEQLKKEEILAKARDLGSPTPPSGEDETDLVGEQDLSSISKASSNYSKITDDGSSLEDIQVHEDSSIELENPGNIQFSLWVSFAEIYNEFIYDLLVEAPSKGKLRPALKLSEDKNHNHFIKGLQEVKVDSVEEAMLLLKLGLQHRHVAATRLNYQSSRSHSIYTLKMVKVVSTERPHVAWINRISMVDLAGAERSGKTGATGVRVKEAGNINNSLLTLGKCIDAMKYNQCKRAGEDRVVPFRESKLTRLFQNYFVGKGRGVRQGRITMVVNAASTGSVFDETMHVLKFSALTSKVVPIVKSVPGPSVPMTPLPLTQPRPPTHPMAPIAEGMETSHEARLEGEGECDTVKAVRARVSRGVDGGDGASCEQCEVLRVELEQCRKETKVLGVRLIEQEYVLRQEVCREFSEQLTEIEERHSHELEEQAGDLQEMYDKRVQLLQKSMKKQFSRKRRRPNDEECEGEEGGSERRLRVEVANLSERVGELEEELDLERNRAAAEFQDASETYETKVVQLSSQNAEMALRFDESKRREERVNAECDLLKEQLAEAREAETHLQSEFSAMKEQLGSAKQRADQLATERDEWDSEKTTLLSKTEERETQLRSEIDALQDQLETSGKKVVELEDLKEFLEDEKSSKAEDTELQLRAECDSLREQLDRVTQRAAECDSLREQLDQVTQRAAECDSLREQLDQVTQRAAECDSLREQLDQVTQRAAECDSMREQLDQVTQRAAECDSLREQLDQVTQRASECDSLREQLDRVMQRVAELASQNGDLEMERDSILVKYEEGQSTSTELEEAREQLRQASETCSEKETELSCLRCEVEALLTQLQESQNELSSLQQDHSRDVRRLLEAHKREVSTLQEELSSLQTRAASRQEHTYQLEDERDQRVREVRVLETQLAEKTSEVLALQGRVSELEENHSTLSVEMRESVRKTLREYETTLKTQTSRIQELERERNALQSHSEELSVTSGELELRLERANAQRKALGDRIEDVTSQLEDSRKALTQREAELLDSSDQCKAVLEEQIAELRKTAATLEHELCSSREDMKTTQQQLREKEEELLSLARGSSEEKAALHSLRSEVEELRSQLEQTSREYQQQMDATQGHHQLEMAQLTIRVRELTEQLEMRTEELVSASSSREGEVEGVREEWGKEVAQLNKEIKQQEKKLLKLKGLDQEVKTLKKTVTQLKRELKENEEEVARQGEAHERELETVRETCRREVQAARWTTPTGEGVESAREREEEEPLYEEPPDDCTIYEPIPGEGEGERVYDEPPCSSPVLRSIENTAGKSSQPTEEEEQEMDRSKPYVPILERSSQLVEDSFSQREDRIEIDATPAIVRKKVGRGRTRKRSLSSVEREASPAPKKTKYPLRNRKKPKRYTEDTDSENIVPVIKTPSLKKLTQCITGTAKTIKKTASKKGFSSPHTPPSASPSPFVAPTTRRKIRSIRKSQISGPLELLMSPATGRCVLDSKARVLLGRQLRPCKSSARIIK